MFGSITSIANNNSLHVYFTQLSHLYVQFYSKDCKWFLQDKYTMNYSLWSFGNFTINNSMFSVKEIKKILLKVSFKRIRLYTWLKSFFLVQMARMGVSMHNITSYDNCAYCSISSSILLPSALWPANLKNVTSVLKMKTGNWYQSFILNIMIITTTTMMISLCHHGEHFYWYS